jgi:hypothetical protein
LDNSYRGKLEVNGCLKTGTKVNFPLPGIREAQVSLALEPLAEP